MMGIEVRSTNCKKFEKQDAKIKEWLRILMSGDEKMRNTRYKILGKTL